MCADGAGFLDCSEDPQEKSWLLGFLFSSFQRRKQSMRITSTSVMRRLPSGVVVVLAAFPKSAKTTIIECTIDGSKVPKAADLEALKLRTSTEINEIMSKSGERLTRSRHLLWLPLYRNMLRLSNFSRIIWMRRLEQALSFILLHRARTFPWRGKQMMIVSDFSSLTSPMFLTVLLVVCKDLEGGRESVCSANAKGLLDW